MAKSRLQKKDTSKVLVDAFKGAKSVAFADYQGMTVPQVDALRKSAREAGVTYMVAKKSLLTLAAKEAGIELNAKSFAGMIGAAFGQEDEIAPAKVLGDMTKGTTLKLVGGIFDGKSVDKEKVIALSKLPSKHQLLGMLVGTIAAPMSAFVRALDALRQEREKGAAPAPKAPEAAPVAEAAPAPEAAAPEAAPAEAAPAEAPAAEAPAAPEAPAAEPAAV